MNKQHEHKASLGGKWIPHIPPVVHETSSFPHVNSSFRQADTADGWTHRSCSVWIQCLFSSSAQMQHSWSTVIGWDLKGQQGGGGFSHWLPQRCILFLNWMAGYLCGLNADHLSPNDIFHIPVVVGVHVMWEFSSVTVCDPKCMTLQTACTHQNSDCMCGRRPCTRTPSVQCKDHIQVSILGLLQHRGSVWESALSTL